MIRQLKLLKKKDESLNENKKDNRIKDIEFVMNSDEVKNPAGIVKVEGSGTKYKVTLYDGRIADIEFDPNWDEWVYYVNGEGPFPHNSYEYILSDVETVLNGKEDIKEDLPDLPVHEPDEILEPAEEAETTAVVDPRDAELVNKLTRIAHDTATAIADSYGVEVNESAILADLIQDLQLVSGQISPEELADTPINNLTKVMYDAYNGFYDALDELASWATGRPIRTTQAQKIQQALASLDSELFTTETIRDRIQSPEFLIAMQHANVPGITYAGDPRDIRLLNAPVEEAINEEVVKEGLFQRFFLKK